jgi:hypothetical protein
MLNIVHTEKMPHLDSPIIVTSNQILLVTISKVVAAIYNNWMFIF